MRNLEELKQQGRILLDEKRDGFVKQRLLSDEFFEMIQKNKNTIYRSNGRLINLKQSTILCAIGLALQIINSTNLLRKTTSFGRFTLCVIKTTVEMK